MAYTGPPSAGYDDLSGYRSEGAREPGARRRKLAGYLKAANELRQNYFAQDAGTGGRDLDDETGNGAGSFPAAAIFRSGNEEMILFPSYARKHVKKRARAPPPMPADSNMSEQEYWRREWDRHQDDTAIVDVDVRGWIYTPHRGPINRKQRLAIGVVRQIAGLPAPSGQPESGPASSQAPSRRSSPYGTSKQDEDLINLEAENIIRKGEREERLARRGAFSEAPRQDEDGIYNNSSLASSRASSPERGRNRLSQVSTTSSIDSDPGTITPPSKRTSWSQSSKMTPAELHKANSHMMHRLKPFFSNPLANSPVKAIFYNQTTSRQRTVYTDAAGHFTCRAELDFIPTHVRILVGENLSATEEVIITSPKGVSLISDIDDTIKHSAITSGPKEIFRTAFVKELSDLTIDGVREWYNTLHDMGVKLHYVSNSPWQMYPVLTTYFKLAHLPKGSFHLKQYSGMLQGIFEPVAERKKSNLDKIMRDFPERKFILVGDSGEADLEVYTEVAVENPGRILGIFIRDVTTSKKTGYFDPSNGSSGGGKNAPTWSWPKNGDNLSQSKRISRPDDIRDDDADLRAAVAASLADMEEETNRARKSINPDSPSPEKTDTPRPKPGLPPRRSVGKSLTGTPIVPSPEEDLIDFSDKPTRNESLLTPPARNNAVYLMKENGLAHTKPSPSPPPKPSALRSPSPGLQSQPNPENAAKTPPPRPRKPSTAVKPPSPELVKSWTPKPALPQASQHYPSPLSQVTQQSPEAKDRPPLPTRPKAFRSVTQGIASAHGGFAHHAHAQPDFTSGQLRASTVASRPDSLRTISTSTNATNDLRPLTSTTGKPEPPPRLRRRQTPSLTSFATTRSKSSSRLSGGWDDASTTNLPGTPGEAGVSKKEFLWNQRWARAKAILDRQGVTLRSWRVGSDIADVCVRLAEQALRETEKENKREPKE